MKRKKGRGRTAIELRVSGRGDMEPRSPSPMAYPLELRERAVREVLDHGATYADVARLLRRKKKVPRHVSEQMW